MTTTNRLDVIVAAIDDPTLTNEVAKLRKHERLLFGSLPFIPGDRVVLREDVPSQQPHFADGQPNGWFAYREVLVPGSTGEAVEVWHGERNGWTAAVRFDVEWSVHHPNGVPVRHVYQRDRRHVFALPFGWLRPAAPGDEPLTTPVDAS